MQRMLELADSIEKIPQFFGKLGAWLILPLITIILFDVLTRFAFGDFLLRNFGIDVSYKSVQEWIQSTSAYQVLSPTKLQEWEWHLHAALFMLAIGFSYTMNAHVRVDVLREKLSNRKQAWIELMGICVFLIPYVLVIGFLCWDFVGRAYSSNEVSASMTGLSHRWIIKSFLLVGLILVLLAGIATAIRQWAFLFGPEHLRGDVKMNILASAISEHLPQLDDEAVFGTAHSLDYDLEHADIQSDNRPHPEIKY
jgi:TRAP-type mannitol/chloroaromatic compound transport system permease small subunit